MADPGRGKWGSRRPEPQRKRHDETRQTGRGLRKRTQIVEAGAQVFAARGYAGTTLNEIAELAGTQAASMYYYFPSREDLIVEILTRGAAENLENVKEAIERLSDEASSSERLRAALAAHVRYIVESDFSRAGIRSIGQLPPDIEERVRPHWEPYTRFFGELFRGAAREGFLAKDVDPDALRMLVLGAANWMTHWFNPRGRVPAEYLGELLIRMVFDGCAAEAGASPAVATGRPKKRAAARAVSTSRSKKAG